MTCPACSKQSRVTKTISNGGTTTRYRTCQACNHHFITIEVQDSKYAALQTTASQARHHLQMFHDAIHNVELTAALDKENMP